MLEHLIYMSGEEFVKKILDDERDLSSIKLKPEFDLSGYEGFKELQDYLREQNLNENPIYIRDSEFMYIKAKGLFLPYVRGVRSKFEGANLSGAKLMRAEFCGANFKGADLSGTDFGESDFWEAYFTEANLTRAIFNGAEFSNANLDSANLEGADLLMADFNDANLKRANLKNVMNLEKTLNIEYAHFYDTKVTDKEMKIIELKRRKLFIIE